jgi:peptidoglycan/LPS O-acetylase OafA/YrhL
MLDKEHHSRIAGLDGLRAIAIIAVISSHLGLYMSLPPELAGRLIPVIGGGAGVTWFFVLSGYLITTLLVREKERTGSISITRFMARRLLRLTPGLAVFVAVVGTLMYLGLISKTWVGLLLAAGYLYNFVGYGGDYTPELAHTWSLAIEEHFYLIWPCLLLLTNPSRATKMAASLFLLCILVRVGMGNSAPATHARWTVPGMAPILAGCLIGLVSAMERGQLSPGRLETWSSSRWWPYLGVILWALPLYVPTGGHIIIWPIHLVGIAIAIHWVATNPSSKVTCALSWRPLAYLGVISYGLYLWQGLFITNSPVGEKLWIQRFPQNILLTVGAAAISWHTIERLGLNYRKRFFGH